MFELSRQRARTLILMCALAACAAGPPPRAPAAAAVPPPRDGAHDFAFELGTWTTHVRRLQRPLSGSTTWVTYEGTSMVRPVWDGRANLVELVADGEAGHLELLSLRLYDPTTRQWSLHVASSRGGGISPPTIGHFANGRGVFFGDETYAGRPIRVRFVISEITPTSCRFEQAFSTDGGATWEVNWIATDTRAGLSGAGSR